MNSNLGIRLQEYFAGEPDGTTDQTMSDFDLSISHIFDKKDKALRIRKIPGAYKSVILVLPSGTLIVEEAGELRALKRFELEALEFFTNELGKLYDAGRVVNRSGACQVAEYC